MSRIPGYELSSIIVGEHGEKLAYYDTGAVQANAAYRTLIIFHGLNYTSPVFEKLLPLAPQKGIRLVLVDRRGYGRSSYITEQEVEAHLGGDASADTLNAFTRARGRETGRFAIRFAEQEKLPEKSVTLLAWSIGNRNLLGLLASLDNVDPTELAGLYKYLAGLILWDPPYHAFGFAKPGDFSYNPILDSTIPEEDKNRVLEVWLSGYYDHAPGFTDDYTKFSFQHPGKDVIPTVDNISEEAASRILDTRAAGAYEIVMIEKGNALKPYKTLTEQAFSPESGEIKLPDIKIAALYGTRSLWEVVLGPIELDKYVKARRASGKPARHVDRVAVEGGNHFVSYYCAIVDWNGRDLIEPYRKAALGRA